MTDRFGRFFGPPTGGDGGGHERAGGEGAGGMPGQDDADLIAQRLLREAGQTGRSLSRPEAQGLAERIVGDANRAVLALDGAPDWRLDAVQTAALEAVILTRGRPALRVFDTLFEDIRSDPHSSLWATVLTTHEQRLRATCNATAALRVQDTLLGGEPFVQGTAILLAPGLALTNRHVIFPPGGGLALARRLPGTTRAALKSSLTLTLDFAHDAGTLRPPKMRVTGVAFAAESADPVDAALLTVEPVEGPPPAPMALSKLADPALDRLYIVGHPGRMFTVPEKVQMVFGTPDGRKRLSFGELMVPWESGATEIVHDASTIGGYSGAAVMGFGDGEMQALHYWGDPTYGNRAVVAAKIRAHPVLGPLLAAGRAP